MEAVTAIRKEVFSPAAHFMDKILNNWLHLCKPMLNLFFKFTSTLIEPKQFPTIFHREF
jgi:hypothetical protein